MLSEKELLDAVVRYVFSAEGRRPSAAEVAAMFNRGLASKSYPQAEPEPTGYLVKVGAVLYEIPTTCPLITSLP